MRRFRRIGPIGIFKINHNLYYNTYKTKQTDKAQITVPVMMLTPNLFSKMLKKYSPGPLHVSPISIFAIPVTPNLVWNKQKTRSDTATC